MALLTYEELKKLPDISIRMYKSIYNLPASASLEDLAVEMGIIEKPVNSNLSLDDLTALIEEEFKNIDHDKDGVISNILGVDKNRFENEAQFGFVSPLVEHFMRNRDVLKAKTVSNVLKTYNIRELAYITYMIYDGFSELPYTLTEYLSKNASNYKYYKFEGMYFMLPSTSTAEVAAIEVITPRIYNIDDSGNEIEKFLIDFAAACAELDTNTEKMEYIFKELSKHGEQVFLDYIKLAQTQLADTVCYINKYSEDFDLSKFNIKIS